ncbi:MAG: lamin tail domain-containing protein [Verrucomicrobiales bacterium]
MAEPVQPPAVVNTPAQSITFFTAEVGGEITDNGGQDPAVTIYFGTADGGTDAAAWQNARPLGIQGGAFSEELLELTHNTPFFFRAYAENTAGGAWAPATATFTTQQIFPPSVVNAAAAKISPIAAELRGTVTPTGGESANVTIYFGTADGGTNPAAWENAVALPVGQDGDFAAFASNLTPATTYFFTAFAENLGGGTWAAPARSFTTADGTVLLNEFMAANDSTAVPNAVPGSFEDWIEIWNPLGTTVDLSGWFLTDDASRPDKWAFPDGTEIGGGAFLVVFASGLAVPDANGNLHTNFRLGSSEYLGLRKPDGSVVTEYPPGGGTYPEQPDDVSYGIHPNDQSVVFFTTPTPGAPNDAGGQLRVKDTKFSHRRGFYTAAFSVEITTATPGATIRYTVDGSDQTPANGSTYSAPIPVAATTVLRARAYADGLMPTNIDTQSYIFPEQVRTQTRPAGYPTAWGGEPSADYDVDTNVSQDPTYAARWLEGIYDLPVISVAAHRDSFFGAGGIYVDTQNRNLEKAVSAEYFHPSAGGDGALAEDGFQLDCGIKLQGGASRNPASSIKHSMSLRFRDLYGEGKLDYRVFEDSTLDEFNALHLRAMYNNSWIHSNAAQRTRATMIRDQWMRDSLIAMGNDDGGHGKYVHLFLNGIYWGVYNLHERLENSNYAAYNGGDEDLIDSHNPSPNDPTPASWTQLASFVAARDWAEIKARLDIDSYCDFYLMQHFGHNDDLKLDGNWRAAGGGAANAPWRLYCWDSERILENVSNTGNLAVNQDGANFIDALDDIEEFRVRFADRAQKHLFNGGALTSDRSCARFVRWRDVLNTAIVCESSRWGDDRAEPPYTRDSHWVPATDEVIDNFFCRGEPNRTSYFITKLRSTNWPGSSVRMLLNTEAPFFTVNGTPRHGGALRVAGGALDALGAGAAAGQIYYTTDGSDPRVEGGAIAGSAILLGGGDIALAQSGLVRMRALNGGDWSPLVEAEFYLEELATAGTLQITEVNYNPYPPSNAEIAAAGVALESDDFEFIEIANLAAWPVNLAGSRFSDGVEIAFGNVTIPAGGRVVVVRDPVAFEARFGTGLPVAGTFAGALDNGGETLAMRDASNDPLLSTAYGDGRKWADRADGRGSSLELIAGSDPADPRSWRASAEFGGSPGVDGAGAGSGVVVNEVLAHTDLPQKDSIELLNTSGSPVDVSGWFLSDAASRFTKFRIPDGTVLPAGGYLIFDEDDFNPGLGSNLSDFALSSANGDRLYLIEADPATGEMLRFSDDVDFPGSYNGVSYGRWPDGIGRLGQMESLTLGAANSTPVLSAVLISEVAYHPPSSPDGALEFVEICNAGAAAVALENWTLRGGADFDFTAAHTLAPGGVLVVVGFDPADAVAADAFRAAYGIGGSVALAGPWEAGDFLCKTWDVVSLRSPDDPPLEDPDDYPQVIADEVQYFAAAPWPASAAGGGSSLHRLAPAGFGSLAASWVADAPSPGTATKPAGQPYADWASGFFDLSDPDTAPGDDFNQDGIPNAIAYVLGFDPTGFPPPGSLPQIVADGAGGSTLAFSIPGDLTGVEIIIEFSDNLIGWGEATPVQAGTDGSRLLMEAALPASATGRMFARLRVVLLP